MSDPSTPLRLRCSLYREENPALYDLLAPLAYRARGRALRALLQDGLLYRKGVLMPPRPDIPTPPPVAEAAPESEDHGFYLDPSQFRFSADMG